MLRRALFAGTAAMAGAVGASLAWSEAEAKPSQPTSQIPDIAVFDQDDRGHRFYRDLVRGRVVLINFFYTGCAEVCPLVTQNLREVQDLLGERMGQDIFMYSISLQPELETPAVLKDYAEQWQVLPGWRFLTGRLEDIEELRKALGFASANPAYDRVRDNHTGLLRYGNDRVDRWAGTPGMGRPAWIAKAVSALAEYG